jgi:hypothetical protein
MNIVEFLSRRGAELPAVMAKVDATVGLGARDVLLAVGSIVEGLGNSKSDLDLLLITPRGKSSLPSQDSVALLVGACLIDVRILRQVEIEELLSRFKIWSQSPWNVTHPVGFTLEERILLHRLLHGHILHKGKSERIMARMPALIDLARLKLQVARQTSRTIQVDMAGYREARDFASLVFAAQEVLGHAVDALLAGYRLTNPISKWRSRMLESLPSDWERSLAVRPTGLTASERVWRLHRAPERPDEKPALEHAFCITTFARAVFMWGETRLVNGSRAKHKPAFWPRVERRPRDAPLPYLDFDVDFFLREGRVTIARLNEFDVTLQMSPREFALMLLFDGATTPREAERFVYGSRRSQARSSVIDQLVSQVTRAGLSVSPNGKQRAVDGTQTSSSHRARKKRS